MLLFCIERVVKLLLLYYSGLLPFVSLKETHFEIPMPSIYFRIGIKGRDLTPLQKFLVQAVDCILLRKSLIDHLKKRGIPTYIWVLNREEDFERAFRLGASGVMTDYPTLLNEFLKQNPQYLKDDEVKYS